MSNRPSLAFALMLSTAPLAAAEDAAPATAATLDAVSVVGRGERRQVQRIDAVQARHHAPGSSPLRWLQDRPGVNWQSADPFGSYEWSTRITVRGFAQNQLGFTLDGVPLGDMSYANHSGLHLSRAVIAENVDEMELAQGSSSIDTPAAHALGGSVRALTRAPAGDYGGQFQQGFGSDQARRSYLRLDSGALGPLRLALSAVDQRSDKWKGDGEQRHRQFNGQGVWQGQTLELRGYLASSRRREADYADLSLESQGRLGYDWDNYAPDWERAIAAAGGAYSGGVTSLDDAYYLGRGLRDDDLGYLALDGSAGEALSWRVLGYYHRNQGQGHWITPYAQSPDVPLALRTTEYDIERHGWLPSIELDLDRHSLQAGLWFEDNVHGLQRNLYALSRATPPDAARYYRDPVLRLFRQRFDIRTRQWYLRDRWQLLDDALDLEIGFKGADVQMDVRSLIGNRAGGRLRMRDRFQPQAGLRWRVDELHELFVAGSESTAAFRPGVEGPFSATQSAFDEFGPGLQPERSRVIETGWRYRREQLELSAALYRVRFNNRLLGLQRCSGIEGCPFGFANVGSVDTRGAEFALSLPLGEAWSGYASLSWNDSRYQQDYLDGGQVVPTADQQVVDSPRVLASSRLSYRSGHWNGSLAAKYSGRRYYTYSNDGSVPGYTLVDADLAFDASHWLRGGSLRLRLQISNLLDRRYFATLGSNGFVASDPDGLHYTLLAGAPRQLFASAEFGW